ncbi:PDZ domain-containing protein [Labilibaculum sp. A4]|uniref:PDZ domain-containing protein n=1 Tax=Labilibaculum euxinus TaxID=2686357 RepID=A0A425Y9R9_9BACT|nr:S41 family peptidase [Labilibaculum euxinus]MDQ1771767.1 S41 family peptidase [Labilibaculum euxinus]MUP36920.1 PDZ domain-containing protein [Labilibaculum euxinus]MVB06125.1 PDZ domain-containing protein [Labilibaculum euxinus]MWN77244.1 PDZ domain-containing protein [Labilibaculum euxinus]
MKLRKKSGAIWLLAVLLFCSAAFWGFNRDERNFEISKNLNIYYTLFRELNLFYVDEIDPGDLVKKSMDAMLSTLDPYTTYISESEIEDFKLMTTGEYAGIGSLISKHKDEVIIAEPYEGFPAFKAGLKAGDVLLEINGTPVSKKSTDDVSSLLKGQPNVPLTIKIKRPGVDKTMEKKLVRENIQLKSVPYYGMVSDSIGYILLNQFTDKASGEIKAALKELKEQNAKSIVLDLRGNPGGLLDQAIEIVNLFVDKGEDIVSTKGKVSQWDKSYTATKTPFDAKIPIAVLVNRGSASASEIVSGAIQDLDRGIIIGERTFGKGLVQTTRNLTYNAKLKVTTAKYYIPSGRCIQALDYSHRNEDGSVGKIADSLITEFHTKNGRSVYDGGGVLPDLKIESERYSSLSINLIRHFLVFDYATLYANSHDKIAGAKEFKISDQEFEKFSKYIKEQKFVYESESTEILDALKKSAKEEKYFDISTNEFDALTAKLTPNLDRDLTRFKDEISDLLAHEIIKRYYYQNGGIEYSLKEDKTLLKAIEVLQDKNEYLGILDGSIGLHALNK